MVFDQNLINLTKICQKREKFYNRVNELYDFILSTYPMMDDLLLERFEDDNIERLGANPEMRQALVNIFDTILNETNHEEFFKNIDEILEEPINRIIIIIYNFTLNKLSINDIKYSIYLEIFGIDLEDFMGLSLEATLSLCELHNRGVDILQFAGYGNYYIEFANKAANGKFKNVEYAKVRGIVATSIDDCMITGDTTELNFRNGSIIFEKMEDDIVSVFDSNELDVPIAILNDDNEFLIGNYDVLLKYYDDDEPEDIKLDGIDEIVNLYNGSVE